MSLSSGVRFHLPIRASMPSASSPASALLLIFPCFGRARRTVKSRKRNEGSPDAETKATASTTSCAEPNFPLKSASTSGSQTGNDATGRRIPMPRAPYPSGGRRIVGPPAPTVERGAEAADCRRDPRAGGLGADGGAAPKPSAPGVVGRSDFQIWTICRTPSLHWRPPKSAGIPDDPPPAHRRSRRRAASGAAASGMGTFDPDGRTDPFRQDSRPIMSP